MTIRPIIDATFAKTQFEKIPLEPRFLRNDQSSLYIEPSVLTKLAEEAFVRISYYLRPSHLKLWSEQLNSNTLTANDRLVLETLLKNALISAEGKLPLCQDTGTATIIGWKEESVRTGAEDGEALSNGVLQAYTGHPLRASQVGFRSLFDEFDTGNNLPAQIHIEAVRDNSEGPEYRFLFIAKGGGSANKTALFQMTKALLEPETFKAFLKEKIAALGTAACPPYRLAVVVGGTSPEENLSILKLATTELLDTAPRMESAFKNNGSHWLYRDTEWESILMNITRESGLGAQFGGSLLALDARLIRLPRHAGSCPVSIGVSCSAHRNMLAKINSQGLWLEKLEYHPLEFLKQEGGASAKLAEAFQYKKELKTKGQGSSINIALASENLQISAHPVASISIRHINLDQGIKPALEALRGTRAGDRLLLSGYLLVARDAAHLKWHEALLRGETLPEYLTKHPIYYAGPAATPRGKVIGSFGPTTAQRMDSYAEELMSRGASLITLAKGNRTKAWAEACKTYGGFYLGTIGGAAALIAEENILESEILDYPELGMEAVRRIRVQDLLAFVIIDDQGRDLYNPIGMPTGQASDR
ncbi:FumA C-terminus/TtdB family hydratase beta subunit [Gracilinema caldarium]|uniref:Fumarate hydratase class I n=1 Tax=Gracilinema caldarium (strain ATCC 51460 / DSM 7334 / H1) TaxID=744872 RepID=F8F0J2_GRAC1|nr:FumA C-terminus/TtdB family hydratase beta subunit [Gracilinema caldarium]AEJ19336.1 hydro-lyase, Fe-S type, tartrate/fumarate subfamily, beta subunit [Gracilinema caldarium DSM 7334]